MSLADRERRALRRGNRFEPHGLAADEIEQLCRLLYFYPQVRAAWLVRKSVRIFNDVPSYVLAVDRASGLLEERRRADRMLITGLNGQIRRSCITIIWPRTSRRMRNRLKRACPEPIYQAAHYHLIPASSF